MGTNYYERRHLYSDSELVACYLKNESQIKAAAELGVSRETVARAVRRSGIPLNGRKSHNGNWGGGSPLKITDAQLIEEAQTLSCREIAIKYGMSDERVWRRAKRLGLALDTKGTGGHWRRRSQRYGCREFDESITLKELIKRDKGICKICGEPTDSDDITGGHIGRLYPTLDHIIPLSKGGTHTWNNVQLAHMACNAGKCDKTNGGKV